MAINNLINLIIDWKNYSRHFAYAPKNGEFLDEQLDEAYITLRHLKREKTFPRLSIVRMTTTQTMILDSFTEPIERPANKKVYLVANDNATETPVGSGLYDHELYVIEATKFLELLICDTVTFTGVKGRDYVSNPLVADRVQTQFFGDGETFADSPYRTPIARGDTLEIEPVQDIVQPAPDYPFPQWMAREITLIAPNGDTILIDGATGGVATLDQEGIYRLEYYWWLNYGDTTPVTTTSYGRFHYLISAVRNKLPLKQYTCKDVVNRLLMIVEPLTLGESPRITLDDDTAEKLDKTIAPEFTMTKTTLREALKEVGKKVHGEPRLSITDEGAFVLSYDFYGNTAKASAIKRKYSAKGVSATLGSYCTSIDCSAENLVCRQNYAVGVITEPYKNGFKTVRTEIQYIRVTDENMMFASDKGIEDVYSLKVGFVSKNGSAVTDQWYEIKDYLFEETLYNSQCSSYKQDYPYSKAYALYFKRGDKNIRGLNFKAPDDSILFPSFAKYAIVNILEKITGQTISSADYPLLAFQITYIPYFNVRVSQTKLNLNDIENRDFPAVMPYNQGANLIDTNYFGENIKGVVARLGNVEKTYTYILPFFSDIPKAGTMFDDDYYISTVSTEVLPSYIKCTVGLSKDFNRLSEYISVSSNKRMYEVSEMATFDRSILYKEYVVVGDSVSSSGGTLMDTGFKRSVSDVFKDNVSADTITLVRAWGGTYQHPTFGPDGAYPLALTLLPVTSVPLGNAVVFIWNYADNYSAGATVAYAENNGVSGYFQDDYRYTDLYGRMYYYNFVLETGGITPSTLDEQTAIGLGLPAYNVGYKPVYERYISTVRYSPYIIRKDNREILQFNLQVEIVSNRDGLYIGSAFAGSLSVIGASHTNKPKCYALKFPINKFTQALTATGATFTDGVLDSEYGEEVQYSIAMDEITFGALPCDCKAIAFITDVTANTERVETEEGEELDQTTMVGGDMVLCYINPMKQGETPESIKISFVHDIFKR